MRQTKVGEGVHHFKKISLKLVAFFLYSISTFCIMITVENPLQIITAKLNFSTMEVSCVILRSKLHLVVDDNILHLHSPSPVKVAQKLAGNSIGGNSHCHRYLVISLGTFL